MVPGAAESRTMLRGLVGGIAFDQIPSPMLVLQTYGAGFPLGQTCPLEPNMSFGAFPSRAFQIWYQNQNNFVIFAPVLISPWATWVCEDAKAADMCEEPAVAQRKFQEAARMLRLGETCVRDREGQSSQCVSAT